MPRRAWACWVLGLVATGAATLTWFVPWDAYDSQCSLATRNEHQIRGACLSGAAARMPRFIVLAVAALALIISGTVIALRNRR